MQAGKHYYYLQANLDLIRLFNTSEAEIALNRAGKLSRQQQLRLLRDRMGTTLYMAMAGLFFGILFESFELKSVEHTSSLILGGLSLFFIGATIVRVYRVRQAILQTVPQLAIGIGQLEERQGSYGGYYLYVDGVHFRLKPAQYYHLKANVPYLVYYAPHKKQLLSLERIVFKE